MSSKALITCIVFVVVGAVVENRYLRDAVPFLYEPSPATVVPLPRAFGITVLLLTSFTFWMLSFGMTAGKARSKYREKAEKDGEKNLEQYSYPNLYAMDTSSPNAKAFNCVQRAHLHVLETIAQMFVGSVLTATVYPITTSINLLLWMIGRIAWSNRYADEGADKRYGHPLSKWIWFGVLINIFLGVLVGLNIVFGHLF